jgi:hypothetical protein
MTYPCVPFSSARAGATFSLIVDSYCRRGLQHFSPMSSSPLSPNGIRHRRTKSQKLNPFPKIPSSVEDDALSPKSPFKTSSSRRVPPTGLTLSPAERDILVLSTVVKVLLFPA